MRREYTPGAGGWPTGSALRNARPTLLADHVLECTPAVELLLGEGGGRARAHVVLHGAQPAARAARKRHVIVHDESGDDLTIVAPHDMELLAPVHDVAVVRAMPGDGADQLEDGDARRFRQRERQVVRVAGVGPAVNTRKPRRRASRRRLTRLASRGLVGGTLGEPTLPGAPAREVGRGLAIPADEAKVALDALLGGGGKKSFRSRRTTRALPTWWRACVTMERPRSKPWAASCALSRPRRRCRIRRWCSLKDASGRQDAPRAAAQLVDPEGRVGGRDRREVLGDHAQSGGRARGGRARGPRGASAACPVPPPPLPPHENAERR